MTEFNLAFPHQENGQQSLSIQSGRILFMVGQNGTGKSTLIQIFATNNRGKIRRITAHRQVWFNSDGVDLTPASRVQTGNNITNVDVQEQSRYKDDYAAQRSQVTIFDLIDSENVDARKIAEAARSGRMDDVATLACEQSPISKMNDILKISNLHFQVDIDNGSKVVALREGYPPYSIAELSDGERNALLIIANILTAPTNTLILLDEPERHLHRSIVSPLLSTLLAYRPDCAFVISTHDVTLPHDQESSSALLLRKYFHNPKSWIADYIAAVEGLDEEVASSILGSRRTLLFIEGNSSSLDLQIYQIMFPNITIKPLGSCVDVERVVKGIRLSDENHWIEAFGIIDRDNRSDSECEKYIEAGIIPLEQYSIESLYYHPNVIRAILKRVSLVNEIEPDATFETIINEVVKCIEPHKERLSARFVQRKAKDALSRKAPDWKDIMQGDINIQFSPSELYNQELLLIESILNEKNIEKLISRYPIRETPALGLISEMSLFPSREKYEQAVRKMLIESTEEQEMMKDIIKSVTQIIQT